MMRTQGRVYEPIPLQSFIVYQYIFTVSYCLIIVLECFHRCIHARIVSVHHLDTSQVNSREDNASRKYATSRKDTNFINERGHLL